MALRGNLRDFTITQLLNLINLAGKTGTLIIDGSADQAYVAFRSGKLAFARIGQEDGRLATVLHRANKLTTNQYRAMLHTASWGNPTTINYTSISAQMDSRAARSISVLLRK